ncbi:MAG TPA: hypothetical protein VK661_01635 [Planctomycetota bacterium]|nr:hypothetical protein [Planctomycetota bacterium]
MKTATESRRIADLEYAASRLFLMVEALNSGRIEPGQAESTWAQGLLEDLDIADEVMDQAALDHDDMTGGWTGVA